MGGRGAIRRRQAWALLQDLHWCRWWWAGEWEQGERRAGSLGGGGGSAHNARPASGRPVPPALPWNPGSARYRFLVSNLHSSLVTTASTLRDNANIASQVRHVSNTSQATAHTSKAGIHLPKSVHTILDAEYEYDAHSTLMAHPSCTTRWTVPFACRSCGSAFYKVGDLDAYR